MIPREGVESRIALRDSMSVFSVIPREGVESIQMIHELDRVCRKSDPERGS